VTKAQELGIRIIGPEQFLALLENGSF